MGKAAVVVALVLVAAVGACAGPIATPHGDPAPQLTVNGSGTVQCDFLEHGCRPVLVIARDHWTAPPNWLPADDDIYFNTDRQGDTITLSGSPVGAPQFILPGRHTAAMGVAELNDIVGGDPYVKARITCMTEFDVTFGQTAVVSATYGEPCQLNVSVK